MKKTHPPAFMQYPPQTKKQSSDLSAGMQALPVGNIIEAKVIIRKDYQEIVQTYILCE